MKFYINELGTAVLDSCQKRIADRETGEIKTDKVTGLPIWSVAVFVRQPGAFKAEGIVVNIPSKKDPTEGIEPFTPVMFQGLAISTFNIGGTRVNSFSADSVSAAI